MSSSLPLGAAAQADGDPTTHCVCFSVQARAEPGVMPRVVELFAKRGLVPQKWHSMAAGEALTIDVHIGGLGCDLALYIARSMRQIIGVETVLTSETRPTG